MNSFFRIILMVLAAGFLPFSALPATAAADADADVPPAVTPVEADVIALANRLGEKLRTGSTTPADFAAESAEYDALLAKYRGQHDAEAEILLHRAVFTEAALKDHATMKLILERIVRDYADTKQAETAKRVLAAMTPEAIAAAKARSAAQAAKVSDLRGKPAAEIDFTWSTREGLKKLSDLRGKVVVLDFWATWCGPCVATFPHLQEKVAHFRGSPVVILGVTSLQGKIHRLEAQPIDVSGQPEREYALTEEFKKKFEMTWDIAFSTQRVFNPDYAVNGIPSVAIIAPDGTLRHVGLHPGASEDITRCIEEILQEFKLPLPKA